MKTGSVRRLREVALRAAAHGASFRFARFDETEFVVTRVGDFPDRSTPADVVARRA